MYHRNGRFAGNNIHYDYDNIRGYRKDYNKNGLLAFFLESHISIVRERNETENYITRFGAKGGRGLSLLLKQKCKH